MNLAALSDLQTPWCVHVTATLPIAEHIASGITDIESLAGVAGCDAEALQSVPNYLVSRGVFQARSVRSPSSASSPGRLG